MTRAEKASAVLAARKPDKPEIVNINDVVYTSSAMDASNMSMIVGSDGIVLVDAGANPYASRHIMQEFRKITDKPLKTVIYTHSHADHVGGACGALAGEGEPDIWGRANFGCEDYLDTLLPDISKVRMARQWGFGLPPDKFTMPLGPETMPTYAPDPQVVKRQIRPNRLMATRSHTLEIGGVRIEMHAVPGETSDHLCVWLPDQKILFPGDDIYASFPNLYPTRGSCYRSVQDWYESLRFMRDLGAEYMVMGHSAPLTDKDIIFEWLDSHYKAVKHVFDETVKGMNAGKGPEELAAEICLPEGLAGKSYLGEYYGNIAFSVRSIFCGLLGWFDGDAWKLNPLDPRSEAEHMAALAGGPEALMAKAEQALRSGDPKWGAQLASYALRLDPQDAAAKSVMADCLEEAALEISSSSGRNYMFKRAQELRG